MKIELRYLDPAEWPEAPAPDRRFSQFRAEYGDTLILLCSELTMLGADDVVFEVNIPQGRRRAIRADGWPHSEARAEFPGVIVSFVAAGVPLKFYTDRFQAWKDNLRGIALSLQALRAVDRYGCVHRNEQYRGWSQLPPGEGYEPPEPQPMTRQEAAEYLAGLSGFKPSTILADAEVRNEAHRRAVKQIHPDRGGGHEDFLKLNTAVTVLAEG